MIENPPMSKDVKEFYFKQKCRLKVFEKLKVDRPTSLITAATKYGVIFVGTPTGVQCLKTENILSLDVDHRLSKNVVSYPRRNLHLSVQPSYLSVSADNELLAVTLVPNDCVTLFVYSVASFGSAEIVKKNEVRLSHTPGVTVSDLHWNPGVANMLAFVMSDGTAGVIEFVGISFKILGSIPQNSQASCLCWSPKGKQVVIGAKNGSLTQYKPELKAVKTFSPPQLQGVGSLCVVSVHWLSSFQFIAAYRSTSDSNARANVMVVNVPKNSPTKFVNYEDFCYSSNIARPEHYFIHQPLWNILIVGTTNSMEANILGMDGDNWVQWMLDDGGRAELPLTEDHQDVYNIGMAFDTSLTQPVTIGENLTIEPMPLLVMLSHDGVLSFFQCINILPGATNICQPPQPFPESSGLHLFNLPEAGDTSSLLVPAKEELKSPEVKEPVEQQGFVAQPSITISSSVLGLGKMTVGQANPPQGTLPSYNMNFGFNQQQSGQPINFNQPNSTSTSAHQSWATPVSKFSLGGQTHLGQQNTFQGGLGLGGLGMSQPKTQTLHQTTLSAAGNVSQPTWPLESNQRLMINQAQLKSGSGQPAVSKQSSPVQVSSVPALPHPQQTVFSVSQPNVITQHPLSVPATAQPLISIPQLPVSVSSSSEGGVPSQNQISAGAPSNLPEFNQSQPNQMFKNVPTQNQVSSNSRAPSLSVEHASEHREAPELAPISEVEEEPDEKEALKERIICQELLQNFSLEMEQKQVAIKYISTQTEYNISESKLKDQVIHDIEKLRKCEEELKETGAPDQADVIAIGNNVLELFGWYEKVKAKERMAKNPGYIELMESQDLDPVTKNYLNSIDKYVYYLESQIKQAKAKLESLWDNIGSPHFEVPVMEVIYQSLVAQMNILAAKKTIVDSCETKMKKFNKNRVLRNARRYVGDLELSTLAERLLDSRISDADLLQDISIRDASNNYIMLSKRMAKKNLKEDKVGALHQWHKNHKVITTKVTKKNAVVINSDLLKDETFARVISPGKQSTPYIHVTPKKASSSVPRKSLFTLTNNISDKHLETSELSIGLSNLDIEQSDGGIDKQAVLPTVTTEEVKIKFETKYSPSAIDPVLRNNLSALVSKVLDGNKIEGVENKTIISELWATQGFTSMVCGLEPSSNEVLKEPIPTPASFKGIETQVTPKNKNEIISTSWGAQKPVFSQPYSPLSASSTNTKTTVSTSSVSISSPSTNEQVANTSTASTSLSFNPSGNVGNQSSKSVFSHQTANSSVNSPSFSSNPKNPVASSLLSAEKGSYESPATTAPFYSPTPIKLSTASSNTFSFPTATTVHSFNLPSSLSIVNITPTSRTSSSLSPSSSPLSVPSSNQLLPAAIAAVSTMSGLSTNSSTSVLSKSVATISPSTAVTNPPSISSPNQQSLLTSQSSDVSQVSVSNESTIVTSSVADRENQPKSGALSWTAGHVFGGSASANISALHPATSSSSTSGLIFGGSAVLGSSKTPVASNQSIFGGTSVFTSTPPATTVPNFSSPSITTATDSSGSISTATTSIFGSVNPLLSTTSAFSFSSVPISSSTTSASIISSTSTIPLAAGDSSVSTISSSSTPVSSTLFTSPSVTSTGSSFFVSPSVSTSGSVFGSATTITAVTTATSIFGGTPSTTSSSAFNSASGTTPIFGGTPKSSSLIFGAATTTASFFGNNSVFATSVTTSSIFGGTSTTTTTTTAMSNFSVANTTTTSSVFGGTTTTTPSVFGSTTTTTPAVFGSITTTTPAVFGGNTTTTPSVFGSTTTTTTPAVFGGTTTTTPAVFGGTTTTTPSVFGGTTATTPSVFGSTTTTTPAVFGSTTTTTPAGFGATTTTTPSVFGTSTTTTSVFGTTVSTTAQSVFGASTTTTTSSSVFGAAGTTSSSIFGSVNTTTTSSSIFGGANTTAASSAFGSPNNQGSVFGATSALSSTSFFGTPTTTTSSSFGNQPAASIFGGSSSFGTPSTTNSFFGKAICSPTSTTASVFGSSTSVFGTATTTSANTIFGGSSFQQKSPFGQNTGSMFGQTSSSGGNFGTSGGSLFGSSSSFGSPSSQGNIFQSGTAGNLFGGAANTSPFSGGSPAGNQAAFGSPPTFQTVQRPFGTAAPVFGGQSTFGAAPTFGGSPSFGSPGKVFGGNTGNGQSFGSPTQQSSTFENLANQDTLSFGNLAQQQNFPTNSFGGSSFSSWRS